MIAFDLDGTLIDSLPTSLVIMRQAVLEIDGVALTDERISREFGKPEAEIFDRLASRADPRAIEARYRELVRAHAHEMPCFPGVISLLETLRERGLPTAVYTSRGTPSTSIILEAHALSSFFSASLAGDQVQEQKPDPEGLLKVARVGGWRDGQPAWYVGDSESDWEAARRAGFIAVQAAWNPEVARRGPRDGAIYCTRPEALLSLISI